MEFETWERRGSHHSHRNVGPMVTVGKITLTLNAPTVELLGRPEAVKLAYGSGVVKIIPSTRDDPAAYPLQKHPNCETYSVSFSKFANYYGIDHSVARRYVVRAQGRDVLLDLGSAAENVSAAARL